MTKFTKKEIVAQNKAFRAFNRIIMSKELVSFEQDENGFIAITYKNGQIFKCRGPVVEMAGLQ
jgi:hypothetical protein